MLLTGGKLNMERQHMRPRVEVVVPCPPAEVVARIKAHLARVDGCPYEGQMTHTHLALRLCEVHREFWSPWLDAYIEPNEAGTRVCGRLTPHPSIWTGYVSGYAFLAFAMLAGGALGFTQLTVKHSPWGFWIMPVAGLLAAALYGSAFIGQRIAHEQMILLRQFLYDALDTPLEGSRCASCSPLSSAECPHGDAPGAPTVPAG
jgi:hypothetical protein